MHLWPERVFPDVRTTAAWQSRTASWTSSGWRGDDGKWKSRATPTRPVEELVRERTSFAVKAPWKVWLEAPVAIAGVGRGSGGRAALACSHEGTR